ncbi:MAG TPA: dephospho-CoA kinase [Gemmatimonadaceae bacterium]|nr:dephospho-CoA kinase [Gemmatimonadaceae bacterium]
MSRGMTVIGLTGNVASGKSTVAELLAKKGASVIDADKLARDAVAPGTTALAGIAAQWPSVIAPDGTLDRAALRRVVFADHSARQTLERIVHPVVQQLRDAELERARARGDKWVVYDVPLLFEAGLTDDVDVVVLVDAPAALRRERLTRERGISSEDADAMIAAQMPAAEKRGRAHYVVDNDRDRATLAARVDVLWSTLAREKPPG